MTRQIKRWFWIARKPTAEAKKIKIKQKQKPTTQNQVTSKKKDNFTRCKRICLNAVELFRHLPISSGRNSINKPEPLGHFESSSRIVKPIQSHFHFRKITESARASEEKKQCSNLLSYRRFLYLLCIDLISAFNSQNT